MNSLDQKTWPLCPKCRLKQPRGGFRCPHCQLEKNMTFCYNIQLMVHLRDTHNIEVPAFIPCEICGNRFNDTDEVLQHILIDAHECESEHLTCYCEVMYQFDTEEHLEKHQMSAHPKQATKSSSVKIEPGSDFSKIQGALSLQTLAPMSRMSPFVQNLNPLFSQNFIMQYPHLQANALSLLGSQGHTLGHTQAIHGYPFQSLFHVNVNTNFYPSAGLPVQPIQRLSMPLNLQTNNLHAQGNTVQNLNQIMEAFRKAPAASLKPIQESKKLSSLEISNRAAKILVERGDISVKIVRECTLCGLKKSFDNFLKLVQCTFCPKTFSYSEDLGAHCLERHAENMPSFTERILCPSQNCDYFRESKSPNFATVLLDHYKTVHKESECSYHHICPRASCRGMFGTLQGMNAHDSICKANVSKMTDARNYSKCISCNLTIYPFSLCECIECNLYMANEVDILLHMKDVHNMKDIEEPKKNSSSKISCQFHFICKKPSCNSIFTEFSAFQNHLKLCFLGFSLPLYMLEGNLVQTSIPRSTQEKILQVRENMQRKRANVNSVSESEQGNDSAEVENELSSSSISTAKTWKRSVDNEKDSDRHRRKTAARFSDDETSRKSHSPEIVKIKQEFLEEEENFNEKFDRNSRKGSIQNRESIFDGSIQLELSGGCGRQSSTTELIDRNNEEHLTLLEQPASSAAWDDVMDNLLAYTDSLER